MADAPRITPEELNREMESGAVTVVDVRRGSWNESDSKIRGAVRIDPESYETEIGRLPKNGVVVIYCT